MNNPAINIIILNYNGRELLRECLPSIIESASNYTGKSVITILDNCSTDGSDMLIKNEYKNILFVAAPENRVLISYNEYIIDHVKEEIVILLNNDIKTHPDFIAPLIKYFDKADTFFAAPKQMSFDGLLYQGGKHKLYEKLAYMSAGAYYPGYEKLIELPGNTAYTGNGAFRTDIFKKLGGFDAIFLPGYWEDVDLCYRGWKMGYAGYYEPASVIYHKENSTFKMAFSDKGRFVTSYRNSFLFVWKNMDILFLIKHFILLPFTVAAFVILGRFWHLEGLVKAMFIMFKKKGGRLKDNFLLANRGKIM